jgi:hypothetical protein
MKPDDPTNKAQDARARRTTILECPNCQSHRAVILETRPPKAECADCQNIYKIRTEKPLGSLAYDDEANPERFATWYTDRAQRAQSSLERKRRAGLDVDAPPSLEEFFHVSELIVRDYERDLGPLPSIPDKLLSDARAVGVRV